MTSPSPLLAPLLLLPLVPAPVLSQEAEPEGPLEGHSHQGEAFNEGPRQAAYLMPSPGSVRFPVTSEDPRVGPFVEQGMGQLHGFWYFEAERSFRQAAAFDPDCAIAYWGMALANVDNEERAAGFARQAFLRREGATDREKAYVEAWARFHGVDHDPPKEGEEDKKPKPDKDKARYGRLIKDVEEILFDYPDDIEAKALLVNLLWLGGRKGIQTASRQANQALLDQVFAVEPMHPAHHYRVHLWDSKETAHRVADSAAKVGQSWPSVAHMWHMGGHIWDQMGRYADAAWQQEASARVDHAHLIRDRVLPDQIHNFAHNNEWLVRSMRNCGRVRDAISLSKNMIELPRHPKWNTLDKRGCSASYGRRRLFETLEDFELWDELVELCGTMYLEPSDRAGDESLRAELLGKAYVFLGRIDDARGQIEVLKDLVEKEKRARSASVDEAEAKAMEEDKKDSEVLDAMKAAVEKHASALRDLRKEIDRLETLIEWVQLEEDVEEEDVKKAFDRLEKTRLDTVLLARLALEAGLTEEAEKQARKAAKNRDGQARPIANLAWILSECGKDEEAAETFETLRGYSSRFDLDVPVFRRLGPLAEAVGHSADWRVAYTEGDDVGDRPDLDELGPARWTPPAAPGWSLPDGFGDKLSSAELSGRPTLVIFFLGFGCVHCVEQLLAFKPEIEKFEALGIRVVAIGTDTAEELYESQAEDDEEKAYPFTIVADPKLVVFRRYRVYDDFEEMALHGTFLIDARGKVRWQDVGFEPFMDSDFLLAESERLLGLPDAGPELPTGGPVAASVESPPAEPAAVGGPAREE